MDRVVRRVRRRWGVSGLLSLATHVALVIGCLFGARPPADRLTAERGARVLRETVIAFDLIPQAQAMPAPEDTSAPAVAPAPRHGRSVHRHRPPTDPAPIRLPESRTPIEPPAFTDADAEADAQADSAEAAAAPPAPVLAGPDGQFISPGEAGYLRTYEIYPSLPGPLRVSGRVYTTLSQICVSPEGRVSEVAIKHSAGPELDRALASSLRTWRYRPRVVGGMPRAFCHLIKIDFALR
jgi:hypothetical protein